MARMVESTTILFVPESLLSNAYQAKYVLRRRGAGGEIFFLILLVDCVFFFCFLVCLFFVLFFCSVCCSVACSIQVGLLIISWSRRLALNVYWRGARKNYPLKSMIFHTVEAPIITSIQSMRVKQGTKVRQRSVFHRRGVFNPSSLD